MCRAYRLASLCAALLAIVVLPGCGDDDDGDFDYGPKLSQTEVYKSNVEAQCIDAKERVQALKYPELDSSKQLTEYLRRVMGIQENLHATLLKLKPPASIASQYDKAVSEQNKLGAIVGGYYRASRGGRPFDVVLGQLERELNPQIRIANRAFGKLDIVGCQGQELDLGFSDVG